MKGDDLYAILGLRRNASDESIRGAYRQLVKQVHPDVAGPSARPDFRLVAEAYEILSNPERRRRYNADLDLRESVERRPNGPEPLSARTVSIAEDLRGGLRSLEDEFLDWARRMTRGIQVPKSGGIVPLDVDVVLSPEEAYHGGELPLELPTLAPCPRCNGTGRVWLYPCGVCTGRGERPETVVLRVHIPAGVADQSLWEVPRIDRGLLIRLHVRVDVREG